MKVIVGLGNPGPQYETTRHNIGFLLLDLLADSMGLDFRPKHQGQFAQTMIKSEKVYLLKPQTFMNLSGRSVVDLTAFYKVSPQDMLVVYDDMDLDFGKIRLRAKGSAGGHNGIKSIISELGTEEFWRLKLGIGRPPERWDAAQYVLSQFKDTEIPILEETLAKAEKAALLWVEGQSDKAMNLYNR